MLHAFNGIVASANSLQCFQKNMKYIRPGSAAMRGVKSIFSTASICAFTLLAALSLALSAASEASAQTTLTSATYDAATGELVVTGTNMASGDVIAVNKLTLTGEGAASYALTTSKRLMSKSSKTW